MKTLAVILKDSLDITKHIIENDGEIDSVTNELMQFNMDDLLRKVDSYSHVLARLDSDEAYFKAQAEKFEKTAKTLKNVRDQIKERIKGMMLSSEIYELPGTMETLKLVQSRDKLILEEFQLEKSAFREVISLEPDKELIKEKLQKGEFVKGARLEKSFALRTYVKK